MIIVKEFLREAKFKNKIKRYTSCQPVLLAVAGFVVDGGSLAADVADDLRPKVD